MNPAVHTGLLSGIKQASWKVCFVLKVLAILKENHFGRVC